MTQISLSNLDDQQIYFTMSGIQLVIRLFVFRNQMYIDINYDNTDVVLGKRVLSNKWLLPSYIAANNGNFRFETYKSEREDYITPDGFNTKYRFMSYSATEINQME